MPDGVRTFGPTRAQRETGCSSVGREVFAQLGDAYWKRLLTLRQDAHSVAAGSGLPYGAVSCQCAPIRVMIRSAS